MSETLQPSAAAEGLSLAWRVDAACLRFEAAWTAGTRPRIEDFLDAAPAPERPALLRELLRLELEYRQRGGEGALPQEYRTRFPEHADLVDDIWAAVPPAAVGPSQIGRYRILDTLGAGGMGRVYRAHDPELDRVVAVKVPRCDGTSVTPTQVSRFLREARAAARVRHAHVCPIHDVGVYQGQPYVVMAFVEGQSLAQRLKEHGRYEDCRQAVRLVCQVAEALEAVHAHGIVHRDLKPGNILLDKAGQPLVTDFGLACLADDAEHLTAEGAVMGTPAYMAPEQVDPTVGAVGPHSDVHSLGVVLYQLLTGRLPYQGTVPSILHQIANAAPPTPACFRPELPPALVALVQKAMARQPADRYPSARAFAEALNRWLDGAGSAVAAAADAGAATAPPAAAAPVRAGWGRSWLPWLAAAVALTVIGLAAELNLRSRSPRDRPPEGVAPPPFKGWIDVHVWKRDNPRLRDARLKEEGTLPLKVGDQVRVEAQMDPPAYLYVIQIDTEGKVRPIYPWERGRLDQRQAEQPRASLWLPEQRTSDGELACYAVLPDPPGMETLLLLVRPTPLPFEVALDRLLADMPPQRRQDPRAVVWFENGEVVRHEAERAFALFDPQRIDDPVLQTQVMLQDRLRPYFAYTRAVSYANQGR
jgi:hypothetical protein